MFVALGDLNPAQEAAVRAKARQTFATQAFDPALVDAAFAAQASVPKAAKPAAGKPAAKTVTAKLAKAVQKAASAPGAVVSRPGVGAFGLNRKTVMAIGLGALALAGVAMLAGGAGGRGGRRVARNPRRRKARRRKGSSRAVVRNPREPRSKDRDVQRAIDFRREFHWGYPAKRVSKRKIYPRPRAMTELGEVVAVRYRTKKKGEKARIFHHDFERSRPRLGMDVRNKRLHFYGGTYTVTADGITG